MTQRHGLPLHERPAQPNEPDVFPAPGAYTVEFLLTEEPSHESGLGGWRAHACHGTAQFTIAAAAPDGTVIIVKWQVSSGRAGRDRFVPQILAFV